jgi:hypothetical protein
MLRFFDNLIDGFMGLDLDNRHSGRRSRRNNPHTFYEPDAYMSGALSPNIEIRDRRRRHHRLRHDDMSGDDYYYLSPRWHDRSISAVEPESRRRRSGWSGLFRSRCDRGGFDFDDFGDFGGLDDSGFDFDHGHGQERRRSSRRNRGHDMYFPYIPSIPEIPRVPDIPDNPDVPGIHFDVPRRPSRPRRPRDEWYDMPGTHRTYRTRPGDQSVHLINEHHMAPSVNAAVARGVRRGKVGTD